MKKIFFCLLLIFIPISFLAGCTQLKQNKAPEGKFVQETDLSANYYYLEARFHIKNQEFKKAIATLEKAIAKDPESYILTRDLIRLYLRQNNEKKAMELAEDLVRTAPDNVNGLLLLIQLKKDTIDETKLVEILNKILALDPKNKETFLRLGKIYMEKKNDAQAQALFERMVAQFPEYYVAWFYLGEIHMIQKNYVLAKTQFLKTIDLEPDLLEPRFQLIKIYTLTTPEGYKEKISKTYEDILEIESDNQRALLGNALHLYKTGTKKEAQTIFDELGKEAKTDSRLLMTAFDEYISSKKYEDAIIIFSQMLKTDPDNSTLNFFTGMAYEATKDIKTAISHYLKIKPDHSQYKKTILSIALLYKELGETQTAINYLEDKQKVFPKDIDIITYLSSFYEREHAYEKAINLLNQSLEVSPDNTSLLFRLGAVQDKSGLKDASINTMKKIIEIDPKDASALNYLGYSYADLGIKLDEAVLLIERAYKIRPDDGYIIDSLGWVYYMKGDFENAVKYLEKAAELTSFETIISDHLGDAYQKTNQFKEALSTYQKALANAKEDDQKKVLELKKKIAALKKKNK
ncbi:MAG: tetratricopeptide repeat protein [Desulfobacteraceae bacterium]|nr:tetratricopeptide repeat protein [Desulfobacteraceae bacterium]